MVQGELTIALFHIIILIVKIIIVYFVHVYTICKQDISSAREDFQMKILIRILLVQFVAT